MCLKVVNVLMDEAYFDEGAAGRYGESGYLYNIHSPRNPVTGEVSPTFAGVIKKYAPFDEL